MKASEPDKMDNHEATKPSFSFIIPGAPATKKTSQRPLEYGNPCPTCGERKKRGISGGSKKHDSWFRSAMTYALPLRHQITDQGFRLPITVPVAVAAIFYRTGNWHADVLGYAQALGDYLQAPNKKRRGAGIIADDFLIASWDGTRRAVDKADPRIEVTITLLEEIEPDPQLELLERHTIIDIGAISDVCVGCNSYIDEVADFAHRLGDASYCPKCCPECEREFLNEPV